MGTNVVKVHPSAVAPGSTYLKSSVGPTRTAFTANEDTVRRCFR